MAHLWLIYPLEMEKIHSYVSLPEGDFGSAYIDTAFVNRSVMAAGTLR